MIADAFPLRYVPHRLIAAHLRLGWKIEPGASPLSWSVLMRWIGNGEPRVPHGA